MQLLAIDVGNSRIKWASHDGARWLARGALDRGRLADLETIWGGFPAGCRVIGSNVAGRDVTERIDAVLAAQGCATQWIVSTRAQCGVRNLYGNPVQLGTDRWAALIGARSMETGACLVVGAGTAVTVDALSENGDFLGGIILPGLRLMHEALARDTSRLGSDQGCYAAFPRNTADAMASGAIQAVAGAVERMRVRLGAAVQGPVHVIASGGSMDILAPHLPADARLVENLVLEGLVIIAAES